MECFDIFSEIGKVIVDLDAIRRITKEMLEDFAKEGVVYLEIRSTPKRLLAQRRRCDGSFSLASVPTEELATKRQYCEAVIETIDICCDDGGLGSKWLSTHCWIIDNSRCR